MNANVLKMPYKDYKPFKPQKNDENIPIHNKFTTNYKKVYRETKKPHVNQAFKIPRNECVITSPFNNKQYRNNRPLFHNNKISGHKLQQNRNLQSIHFTKNNKSSRCPVISEFKNSGNSKQGSGYQNPLSIDIRSSLSPNTSFQTDRIIRELKQENNRLKYDLKNELDTDSVEYKRRYKEIKQNYETIEKKYNALKTETKNKLLNNYLKSEKLNRLNIDIIKKELVFKYSNNDNETIKELKEQIKHLEYEKKTYLKCKLKSS